MSAILNHSRILTNFSIQNRVFSEKEKSFREKKFSRPFRFVFAFRLLVKNAKIFAFVAKFRFIHSLIVMVERMYQILRYQSREFHKFFWVIYCCSYNTHGFTKFSHFAKIFSRNFHISHFSRNFALFSLYLFSRKNAKLRDKICEMRTKIFAFFCETFRSLETLAVLHATFLLYTWSVRSSVSLVLYLIKGTVSVI